jgi:hypothetical protein
MRIHRSYIVNLLKIQEVNKNRVILEPDATAGAAHTQEVNLPVGDLYKEQFNNYVESHYLGK